MCYLLSVVKMVKRHKTAMTRSENMARIKSKNTSIEMLLRKALWKKGIRYRIHDKTVFGKPDIIFKSKKIAIFCDSEFWHGYQWEEQKKRIKTNFSFWDKKIENNIKRDKTVNEYLIANGWTVIRFWAEDIEKHLDECINKIVQLL